MNENKEGTQTNEAAHDNEAGRQLTLHEAQVQACMCMNRILYLTQDPEINSFFVSYVAGFSDFDPGYKTLVQNLLTIVAPTVGMQINNAPESTPAPLAWGYDATNDAQQPEIEAPENNNAPGTTTTLRP